MNQSIPCLIPVLGGLRTGIFFNGLVGKIFNVYFFRVASAAGYCRICVIFEGDAPKNVDVVFGLLACPRYQDSARVVPRYQVLFQLGCMQKHMPDDRFRHGLPLTHVADAHKGIDWVTGVLHPAGEFIHEFVRVA